MPGINDLAEVLGWNRKTVAQYVDGGVLGATIRVTNGESGAPRRMFVDYEYAVKRGMRLKELRESGFTPNELIEYFGEWHWYEYRAVARFLAEYCQKIETNLSDVLVMAKVEHKTEYSDEELHRIAYAALQVHGERCAVAAMNAMKQFDEIEEDLARELKAKLKACEVRKRLLLEEEKRWRKIAAEYGITSAE